MDATIHAEWFKVGEQLSRLNDFTRTHSVKEIVPVGSFVGVMYFDDDSEDPKKQLIEPATGNRAMLYKITGIEDYKRLRDLLLDPFKDELSIENGGMIANINGGSGHHLKFNIKDFEDWWQKNYRRVYEE